MARACTPLSVSRTTLPRSAGSGSTTTQPRRSKKPVHMVFPSPETPVSRGSSRRRCGARNPGHAGEQRDHVVCARSGLVARSSALRASARLVPAGCTTGGRAGGSTGSRVNTSARAPWRRSTAASPKTGAPALVHGRRQGGPDLPGRGGRGGWRAPRWQRGTAWSASFPPAGPGGDNPNGATPRGGVRNGGPARAGR